MITGCTVWRYIRKRIILSSSLWLASTFIWMPDWNNRPLSETRFSHSPLFWSPVPGVLKVMPISLDSPTTYLLNPFPIVSASPLFRLSLKFSQLFIRFPRLLSLFSISGFYSFRSILMMLGSKLYILIVPCSYSTLKNLYFVVLCWDFWHIFRILPSLFYASIWFWT